METGIIGLPLAGKTTIYNALTGQNAETSFSAGVKKTSNLADVEVPDERIDRLYDVFLPKKKVYATVRFRDIQVEFKGSGSIAPACTAEIRNSDALSIVVRSFADETIPHPLERVNPVLDLEKLLESLIFSDYEQVEKRMERLQREGNQKTREFQILQGLATQLENNQLLGPQAIHPEDQKLFSGFAFLTTKPLIVIANTGNKPAGLEELKAKAQTHQLEIFELQGKTEMEISQLAAADQREFLEDLGLHEPAKNRFLKYIYQSLNLISFLTAGEDEVRAWSIPRGYNAQKAAGKIHTDLEKGFIRAEVIEWQDLLQAGNFKQAKSDGKIRLEGKEYIVLDGDVMNIRFNV